MKLNPMKKRQIKALYKEGNSVEAIAKTCGVQRNTVLVMTKDLPLPRMVPGPKLLEAISPEPANDATDPVTEAIARLRATDSSIIRVEFTKEAVAVTREQTEIHMNFRAARG